MIQVNIDSLCRFIHNHLLYIPWELDPQYLCIKSFLIHNLTLYHYIWYIPIKMSDAPFKIYDSISAMNLKDL